MSSPVGSIIRQCFRNSKEKYNILTYVTHERCNSNWSACNANFYMIQKGPGLKGPWLTQYAQIPRNIFILPPVDQPLEYLNHLEIDMVISQHKWGQFQTANQISNYLGIPHIHYEHTCVTSDQLRKQVPELKKMRADYNVFITSQSCSDWNYSENDQDVKVINHGINSEFFRKLNTKRENRVLAIHNDWVGRSEILGFDIFKRNIIDQNIPYRIVGDTRGLSSAAQNEYDLLNEYNKSTIYYNTTRTSPLPMAAAESMSCELPLVCLDNFMLGEIIQNGFNGYKTNDESEQLKHIRRLLADEDERKELGKNARQTIIDRFSIKAFTDNWNKVFDEVSKIRK